MSSLRLGPRLRLQAHMPYNRITRQSATFHQVSYHWTFCCNNFIPLTATTRVLFRKGRSLAMVRDFPFRQRSFHSYDHPPPSGPFGTTETALLQAAYKHVPKHGFTTVALAFGARDAGFPDISTSVLSEGEFSLIRWHLTRQKESLAARAEELFRGKEDGAAESDALRSSHYSVPQKIEMLIWERLVGNRETIEHWQQALAIMAHPTHVPSSVKLLAELADEIVFLAGDKAVDPSWYTTRAGVSAIYASTELVMTSDRTKGFTETRGFLRRRVEEARSLNDTLGGIGQWVGFNAIGVVNVARSWGMNI